MSALERFIAYQAENVGHADEDAMLEWECLIAEMRDENAKLRELVRKYSEYTDQDRCEGCVYKTRCNDGLIDECWQLTEIRGLARELGIEVDDD